MMTANSCEAALHAMSTLINTVHLLEGSHRHEDYEQVLEMVERLIDTDDENPLIDLLAKKIADYENTAPEFEAFNARITALPHYRITARAGNVACDHGSTWPESKQLQRRDWLQLSGQHDPEREA